MNMGNSSVLALGKHPLIDGWRVGFGQNVVSQNQEQEILLKDECLTISGNNSFERKHIIIPNSGKLVEAKVGCCSGYEKWGCGGGIVYCIVCC